MLKLLLTAAGAVYLSDKERRDRLVGKLRDRASEYAAGADNPAARALREGEQALQRAEGRAGGGAGGGAEGGAEGPAGAQGR